MRHTKGQTYDSIYEVPRMVRIMRTGRMQVTCNCKDGNTRLLSTQFQLLEIDGFTILPVTQMLFIFYNDYKNYSGTEEMAQWAMLFMHEFGSPELT